MKITAGIVALVLLYAVFIAEDNVTFKQVCVDGVWYLKFSGGGTTPKYGRDGKIATCKVIDLPASEGSK